MNYAAGAIVLIFCVSSGFSFQCDAVFGVRSCGDYFKAQNSLNDITRITDQVVSNIFEDINNDFASIFKNILPLIKNTDFKKQIIQIDNNTKVVVQGNMTKDDAIKLFKKMMETLKSLEHFQIGSLKELSLINKLITDALRNSLATNGNAYLILDKLSIEKIKDFVRNKLNGPIGSLVRTVIIKLIDRQQGRLQTIGKLLKPILYAIGFQKQYDQITAFIHNVIEEAKATLGGGGAYSLQIDAQIKKAEKDIITFLDGVDKKQAPIVKRGIKDFWSKVQAALDNLGDSMKKTATELVNKYKPKIEETLKKGKRVILDETRRIVLEIQDDIVKILTKNDN